MSKKTSEYWDAEAEEFVFPHPNHYIHQRKPFEGHYASKNEAKLLRKIMAETGLTETEVRARKKYREMLSEAQKVVTKRSEHQKFCDEIIKKACRQTGLPKEHPTTKEILKGMVEGKFEVISGYFGFGRRGHWNCGVCSTYINRLLK